MKIVLTGGGTGGHFYPLIAVAEEVNALVEEKQLVQPELFYLSNDPYDESLLFEKGITYYHVFSGKRRNYLSLKNVTDLFKTILGIPRALYLLYRIWPDVVFSKGGYVSVPVVIAAWVLRIPVFVHDSDALPGRANLLAARWAQRIGTSYADAARYFKGRTDLVAHVGNPIRTDVMIPVTRDAHAYFQFVPELPTIVILGGSQGATAINNTVLQALKDLLGTCQVIHQVGASNYEPFKEIARVELTDFEFANRYRVFPSLDAQQLRYAAGCANLYISRAGSGSIFEIANWEKPAILVPIPGSVSRDQRENAYAYARTGAAVVIEQHNFTPHLLVSEATRLLADHERMATMKAAAARFKMPEAARTIAAEIMDMAMAHEK